MIQSFQCTSCGHQNTFGEPSCTQCGQPFIYNCPICGSHINNRYDKCHGCGAAFNWGMSIQQNHSDTIVSISEGDSRGFPQNPQQNMQPYAFSPAMQPPAAPAGNMGARRPAAQPVKTQGNPLFSSTRFWIILIIACAVLIALLLVVDRFISK